MFFIESEQLQAFRCGFSCVSFSPFHCLRPVVLVKRKVVLISPIRECKFETLCRLYAGVFREKKEKRLVRMLYFVNERPAAKL